MVVTLSLSGIPADHLVRPGNEWHLQVIISNVFDHLVCERLMAQLANIELLQPTPAQIAAIGNAATNLARAMEKAQTILKEKLKVPVIFVTRPGLAP